MKQAMRQMIFRVVLPYVLFAGLWIVLSDRFLSAIFADPEAILYWSIFKGLAFVVVTALLLSALLRVEVWARERGKDAMQAVEQRLVDVIEFLPDATFVIDQDKKVIAWNHACEVMTGVKKESLLGKGDYVYAEPFYGARRPMLIDLLDRPSMELESSYKYVQRKGDMIYAEFFLPQLRGGEEAHLWGVASPLFDRNGRRCGAIEVVRDITERKNVEDKLRKSEQKYRELVENANSIILRWGHEGRINYLNEFGQRFFGYTQSEIIGRHVIGTIVPEIESSGRSLNTLMENICANPEAFEQNINENMLRNGERVWIAWTNKIVLNQKGEVEEILSIGSDITARKRAEESRDTLQAQLIQAQKLESIGTLASGVAHEINNPIMGIKGYAQMILEGVDARSPAAEFAEGIIKAAERVTTIVKNLLSFSRFEKQTHQPARLVDIVDGTLSLIRTVLRHDQITLEVNVPEDLPKIECRSQQIQQVIMNLLTNARDALNEKYPEYDENKKVFITARELSSVECGTLKAGGTAPRSWVRLTVEDHGAGIPEAVRDRIIDPFFTTKPREKGTGLGLSISHGIIKDHGGVLWFESEVGQGTRFHVDLPVA
jgi:PAS domain S-box-containing protein